MNQPFIVICIDDANRPAEIPQDKWIVKDDIYTVEKVVRTLDGNIGFVLKEKVLTEDNFPFRCFDHKRFAVATEEDLKAKEAVQELIKDTCLIEN